MNSNVKIAWRRRVASALCVFVASLAIAEAPNREIRVTPDRVELATPDAQQRLVVELFTSKQRWLDVSALQPIEIRTEPPGLVRIDEQNTLHPQRDGEGRLFVTTRLPNSEAPLETQLKISVSHSKAPREVDFEHDVQEVLTRYGCNAGACHGKQRGQNGFALSLLAFDHDFDYRSVAFGGKGRRVFPAAPSHSLLLRKPSAEVPHGGGRMFRPGDSGYETILTWISTGMTRRRSNAPELASISLYPEERRLEPKQLQRIAVTAHYSDGSRRDVSHLASFQSNEAPIASVDKNGLVRAGPIPGEVAIMARFMGKIAVTRIAIPLPGSVPSELYAQLPRKNFIDDLVWKKLAKLGMTPSAPADDATFLRRVYVDIIGRLPSPGETKDFLVDVRSGKRERLVDALLERPEYADFHANKWADLLRPNPYRVGIKAVFTLDSWLRESFRQNKPYDQFVREIVSASGTTFRNGPAVIFRDRRSPDEIGTMMSQLFLGIRLECAKCHQHPFERWSQKDFYSFAAFFSKIGRKGVGLSPPISGSEEMVFTGSGGGTVAHPRTGAKLTPSPLYGEALVDSPDPRVALVDWMTSPENDYFARVIANRIWADMMGRGIVEPVDDLRDTNPPTNAELLDALAQELRREKFNLKALIRAIATSHVYGLSSMPTERNIADTRNYSRHYRRRLKAEVLLDAYSDITETSERIGALAPGSRSIELWTHRSGSLFLDTFGRPDPNQDPPCDRTTDTSVVQALHLMNSRSLHSKVSDDRGRVKRLADSDATNEEIVVSLYLLAYSRFPTDEEERVAVRWIEGEPTAEETAKDGVAANGSKKAPAERDAAERDAAEPETRQRTRREGIEDVLWTLLNSPEFVFLN